MTATKLRWSKSRSFPAVVHLTWTPYPGETDGLRKAVKRAHLDYAG